MEQWRDKGGDGGYNRSGQSGGGSTETVSIVRLQSFASLWAVFLQQVELCLSRNTGLIQLAKRPITHSHQSLVHIPTNAHLHNTHRLTYSTLRHNSCVLFRHIVRFPYDKTKIENTVYMLRAFLTYLTKKKMNQWNDRLSGFTTV